MDLLMPFLHEAEVRIVVYLVRRTYGFQRDNDTISLDQFVNGLRTETRQLDFGAGVSRRAAISALMVLKDMEVVEQLDGGQGRGRIPVYRLNLKCELMQWLHLISQDPVTAREKIVQRLHLIRLKSASPTPIDGNGADIKETAHKVQNKHLKEKVQRTTVKGANEFSENRASSSLDTPTKPSTTKPRKEALKKDPPVSANAETSPKGDEGGKATRIPKDWQPTAKDYAWAEEKGYDRLLNLESITEGFKYYWESTTKGPKKTDWSKTWRNRVIDQAGHVQSRASPNNYPSKLDIQHASIHAAVDEFIRREKERSNEQQ
jgi:hypothetical protein